MIVVLNFGSQFAHLIARRVRDLGVKAEILPFDTPAKHILTFKPAGIIFSGGPASVLEKRSPRPARGVFHLGIPILGICYGEQVMAEMLGGKVSAGLRREFGKEMLVIGRKGELFNGLGKNEVVWFSHGDQVVKIPKGFVRFASTHDCSNAAIADKTLDFYGIQFHPEVTHTKNGTKILSNFLFNICHAKKDWRVADLKKNLIGVFKNHIGSDHVLVGISGGVDSLVAATVLHKAIGSQLHAVFVDTGLLRENEARDAALSLRAQGFQNLRVMPAEAVFLRRLRGVQNPEQKRKIIGHTFIKIFERVAKREFRRYPIKYFAQGTIYPDRIESAEPSRYASKIKSHHNLTLPEKLDFEIIEPLRDLYKDEVRRLGLLMNLPKNLLWRHPFPGPGLAVRIVGEVTRERLKILREADAIYLQELQRANEYDKIWQAFAVLLPLKTVGVMGDARTYEYIVSLRAVDSIDGMSADWHKMPQDLLERISSRIVREVRGVNRVLYDITQKPPATIEYE